MRNYWQFVSNNWALLLFGFLCVFWGNLGQSFFIGQFSEDIKRNLNMSASEYGTAYSVATLCSAMTMMWLGALIDRWTLRRFVILVATGLFSACLLLSFVNDIVLLVLAFFCVRLFGQGLMPHTGTTTMARHFTDGRGKAVSLAGSAVSVGEVVLPVLAVLALNALGWKMSWWLMALSIPIIFLPLVFGLLKKANWQDLHLVDIREGKKPLSGRRLLLKDYRYWLAAPTVLAIPFMLTAIFIHQDFIVKEKSWSASWMAQCFILYGIVHWMSSVFSGILVDKTSGLKLLPYYILPMLMAMLLVANVDGYWVAPVMMALLGVAIGAAGPVVNATWAEVYGASVIGGVRSASGSIMVLVTAFSPVLYGWLIDAGLSLQMVFNWTAVFFLLGLGLLRFSYRPQAQ